MVAVTLLAYAPAMRTGFIWDDGLYVTGNPDVTRPGSFHRIWVGRQPSVEQYYPLTLTTFWVEYRLWGPNPTGYHVTNILLHAVAAVLAWRVLRRLGVPGAWLGAMLFALHPVAVATTAWITARKSLLSLVFAASSVLAFLRFDEERRYRWYVTSVVLFLLALLGKTAVMPLPAVLLLAVWWRRGRVGSRDVLRVAPFFALAVGLAAVTVWFEHSLAQPRPGLALGVATRLAVAGRAVWFYLAKAVVPVGLTVVYKRWPIDPGRVSPWIPLAAWTIPAAGWWWFRRKRWLRPATLAFAYYVLMLLPVLGFVGIAFMEYAWVADHWQYYSLVGLCALGGAAGRRLCGRRPLTALPGAIAAAAVLTLFFVLTWQRAALYHDTVTLWTDNIRKNPEAPVAYFNRGCFYLGKRDLDKALADLTRAIELDPGIAAFYNNRGCVHFYRRNLEEALADLTRAIELDPAMADAYRNRAMVFFFREDYDRAWADITTCQALGGRVDPKLLMDLRSASGRNR